VPARRLSSEPRGVATGIEYPGTIREAPQPPNSSDQPSPGPTPACSPDRLMGRWTRVSPDWGTRCGLGGASRS
jgi:hypothetical protein